jgi:hypothetical protein
MKIREIITDYDKLPDNIKLVLKETFYNVYKERKGVSGKKAIYSARAAALSEAYKMLSRNIVDRGNTDA